MFTSPAAIGFIGGQPLRSIRSPTILSLASFLISGHGNSARSQ